MRPSLAQSVSPRGWLSPVGPVYVRCPYSLASDPDERSSVKWRVGNSHWDGRVGTMWVQEGSPGEVASTVQEASTVQVASTVEVSWLPPQRGSPLGPRAGKGAVPDLLCDLGQGEDGKVL